MNPRRYPSFVAALVLLAAALTAWAPLRCSAQHSLQDSMLQQGLASGRPAFQPLPAGYYEEFQVANEFNLSGRMAFVALVGGYQRIFALDLDSKRVRVLIDGPGNNFYPSWSPDGTRVVFTSDRDGERRIYTADWTGKNQTRLNASGVFDDPSWSPDGKEIVCYSAPGGSDKLANLAILAPGGAAPRHITSFRQGRNTTPRWSPDGALIAYSTNRFWPGWDICTWDIQARSESCNTTGRESFFRPSWSASGSELAFSYGALSEVDIALQERKSGAIAQLTDLKGAEYDAVWSADDKFVAFTHDPGDRSGYELLVSSVPKERLTAVVKTKYPLRYLSWTKATAFELEVKRVKEQEQQGAAAAARKNGRP